MATQGNSEWFMSAFNHLGIPIHPESHSMSFCILNCRPTFPPARIVPGATRRAGNASRTPSLDQTQRREAVAKQVRKWPKFPTHPKYTRVPISLQNYQCPGTNQKYCASQQGDCKHIGYCDPNATCKKKANVSKQYSSIKTRIDVLVPNATCKNKANVSIGGLVTCMFPILKVYWCVGGLVSGHI